GRERWNYLNFVPLRQIYERWLSPYHELWASSLLRLKREVEAEQPAGGQAGFRQREQQTPTTEDSPR
ncbi:MAG TPA: hypothetical protein VMU55_07525, partial [Solirubrobacteraceae bacterium]|nr:hypothetical protein [Solirubrobacteraceae bacterium]